MLELHTVFLVIITVTPTGQCFSLIYAAW